MSDADTLRRLPELFGRAMLALSMDAALGFAIATIARSQLAGIGVGIGVFFFEGIAGAFLPDVFKWFPFSAASAVVASTVGRGRRWRRRTAGARHRDRRRRGLADRGPRRRVAVDGTGRDRRLSSAVARDRRQHRAGQPREVVRRQLDLEAATAGRDVHRR